MVRGRVVVVGLEVSLPDMFGGGGLLGKGGLADGADELLKRVIVWMAQGDGTSWRCNIRLKRMMKKKTSLLEGEGVMVELVHVVEIGAVALGVVGADVSLLLSARAHMERGHDWESEKKRFGGFQMVLCRSDYQNGNGWDGAWDGIHDEG